MEKRKPPPPGGGGGRSDHSARPESAAAGARLHAGKHETLVFLEINARIHEHGKGLFLQKNFQPIQFDGRIARLGCFGYVHSQRGASTARDDEDPHTVSGSALLCNNFLEFTHCTIRQTNHTSSLTLSGKRR
jgi:hypothetical protein